jgi:hypothetical protein
LKMNFQPPESKKLLLNYLTSSWLMLIAVTVILFYFWFISYIFFHFLLISTLTQNVLIQYEKMKTSNNMFSCFDPE